MRAHLNEPDFLYEALKVYLILGRQGPLDRNLVEQWVDADFDATFPGDDDAEIRDSRSNARAGDAGTAAGAAWRWTAPLVAQVRGMLTREPLAAVSLQPHAAQRGRAVAAGMDGGRQRRAGRRPGVRAARRQAAQHRRCRDLHLRRVSLRLSAAAAAGHQGCLRGCLGARAAAARRRGRHGAAR